ncbi:MAG: hypothetical protein GY928_38110 [Colwellia sp.]|nr:hypothetical protein [Colwellia sp.]
MKKFKKDQLPRKGKKLALNRETIKDLTLRTQVAGGAAGVPGMSTLGSILTLVSTGLITSIGGKYVPGLGYLKI